MHFFFFFKYNIENGSYTKIKGKKRKDIVPVEGTFRCEVPCHRQEGGLQVRKTEAM